MKREPNPTCPIHGNLASRQTLDETIVSLRASSTPEEWARIVEARVAEASLAEINEFIESGKQKVKWL